jgi:hypothetical protein
MYCVIAIGLLAKVRNIPYFQNIFQNEDGYAYQQLNKRQLLGDNSNNCHKHKRSCGMPVLLFVNHNVLP